MIREVAALLCSSPCVENNLKGTIDPLIIMSTYSGVYPVFVYLQLVEAFKISHCFLRLDIAF